MEPTPGMTNAGFFAKVGFHRSGSSTSVSLVLDTLFESLFIAMGVIAEESKGLFHLVT